MILRYLKHDGTQMEFELGERPITIGRSPEADIVIMDDKASRLHCGIRLWDGDFFIKDLKSKNGTFVNGQRIEMTKLNPGDEIRIGTFTMTFDASPQKGDQTILREVAEEMEQGKGYGTILREIVGEVPADKPADKPAKLVKHVSKHGHRPPLKLRIQPPPKKA